MHACMSFFEVCTVIIINLMKQVLRKTKTMVRILSRKEALSMTKVRGN